MHPQVGLGSNRGRKIKGWQHCCLHGDHDRGCFFSSFVVVFRVAVSMIIAETWDTCARVNMTIKCECVCFSCIFGGTVNRVFVFGGQGYGSVFGKGSHCSFGPISNCEKN